MKKSHALFSTPTAGAVFDELLVIMVQAGERGAADRLFQRWNPRLLRAARRYCGDDDAADDLVQECWLGIWKGLRTLRDPARFRSYVFAVLHRRGADHLRRVVRDRSALSVSNDETNAARPAPQPQQAAIKQAFAALPPDQRLAAHLYFAEGLTLREIAAVQSIPEGTAKSRIFHARRALKMALGEQSSNETEGAE